MAIAHRDVVATVADGVRGQEPTDAVVGGPPQAVFLRGKDPSCEGRTLSMEDPDDVHRERLAHPGTKPPARKVPASGSRGWSILRESDWHGGPRRSSKLRG